MASIPVILQCAKTSMFGILSCHFMPVDDDDDDDEGRINFSVALSPKTTRTRNNKLKQ